LGLDSCGCCGHGYDAAGTDVTIILSRGHNMHSKCWMYQRSRQYSTFVAMSQRHPPYSLAQCVQQSPLSPNLYLYLRCPVCEQSVYEHTRCTRDSEPQRLIHCLPTVWVAHINHEPKSWHQHDGILGRPSPDMDPLALDIMKKVAAEKPNIQWTQPAKATDASRNARPELEQLASITMTMNGNHDPENSLQREDPLMAATSELQQGSRINVNRVPTEEHMQTPQEHTDDSSDSSHADEVRVSSQTENPASR